MSTEASMMSQDDGTGREEARAERPLALPDLKSAVARRVRYEQPRRFFQEGDEYAETDAVEIDVETDGELFIAGTGPALFVGDIPIVDSTRVGERRYRFFAPASLPLEEGAPIALGRAGTGVPTIERTTNLRLEWEG
jgi:hypothetical protein